MSDLTLADYRNAAASSARQVDALYIRTRKLEEALVKALRFIPPSMNVPKTLDAALAYFAGSPASGGTERG